MTNHCRNLLELLYDTDIINTSAEEREKLYFEKIRCEYGLPDDYDFLDDPQDVVIDSEFEHVVTWEDADTLLYGFKFNEETNKYEEDPTADFSIIFGELYAQVTQSKYMAFCNKCSPCFPYQGDLETPGDIMTFSIDKETWGADLPEGLIVREIEGTAVNETGLLVKHGRTLGIPMF